MADTTKEKVLFCPQCQCATVDSSALVGGEASCRGCRWKGQREDLLVRDVEHQFSSTEDVLRFFTKDIQFLVGAHLAEPLGRLLLKWGFIIQPVEAPALRRYLVAVTRGVVTGILQEREKIELEAAQLEQAQRGSANDV